MELIHLAAARAHRDEVVRVANTHTVVFQCSDADTVEVAASLVGQLTADFGVWLVVSSAYPAQIAARDVATLAAIIPLRHVVVEASSNSESHADVLRALLTNDEVNFKNDVATIVGAYNRPAPPAPITVWSYDNERLVSGDDVFSKHGGEVSDTREVTYFA
jgi:hypothetical protein